MSESNLRCSGQTEAKRREEKRQPNWPFASAVRKPPALGRRPFHTPRGLTGKKRRSTSVHNDLNKNRFPRLRLHLKRGCDENVEGMD